MLCCRLRALPAELPWYLSRKSTLPSKRSVVGSSPTQGKKRSCPGWCCFVCYALALHPLIHTREFTSMGNSPFLRFGEFGQRDGRTKWHQNKPSLAMRHPHTEQLKDYSLSILLYMTQKPKTQAYVYLTTSFALPPVQLRVVTHRAMPPLSQQNGKQASRPCPVHCSSPANVHLSRLKGAPTQR